MSKVKIGIGVLLVVGSIGFAGGTVSYRLLADEADRKAPLTEKKAVIKEPTKEEKAEGRLPISPSPQQVLVSLTENGQLAVKAPQLIQKPRTELTSDGQGIRSITTYRVDYLLGTAHYDLANIEVLDNEGKKIDKDRLPELLKREIPALSYQSREKLDPLHLRLIKEGTLVFVLPHSDATPAPAPAIALPPQGEPPGPQGRATFPLKKAVASRVASLLINHYKLRYPDDHKQVRIACEDSTNSIIVQATPAELAEIRGLIERIDTAVATGQAEESVRLGRIMIVGNEKTADDLILRAIRLSPGQILRDADLKKAEQNLKRLNVFESATITALETHLDSSDIVVIVQEKDGKERTRAEG